MTPSFFIAPYRPPHGDIQNPARRWLSSPQRALGGSTPLSLARTEVGAGLVEDLIGRLEHGVFS